MRRSTVLSHPLQLVFPVLTYHFQLASELCIKYINNGMCNWSININVCDRLAKFGYFPFGCFYELGVAAINLRSRVTIYYLCGQI
jgi:hypothetical protein